MALYYHGTCFSGGQLIDVLQEAISTPLASEEVLRIFAQTCKAVSHMHNQSPPTIHRDLKVCQTSLAHQELQNNLTL